MMNPLQTLLCFGRTVTHTKARERNQTNFSKYTHSGYPDLRGAHGAPKEALLATQLLLSVVGNI